MHWQAIRLPRLESETKAPRGFRPNKQSFWQRDRQQAFNDTGTLLYLSTENWHPDRLQARGRFNQPLRDSRVALIGCGALGSVVAELLVRGGVGDILLIDHDKLEVANLVRHTLSGQDIGKNKATALATRLSTAAPCASVRAHPIELPNMRGEIEKLLDPRDLMIDCTASDEVLRALGLGWWGISRLFVSASVGYEAKRTFLFAHRGHLFPQDEFRRKLDPMLKDERASWAQRGDTLEGAGCWSPLFPARMDDIMLAAASCVKVIEELVPEVEVEAKLVVFEQVLETEFAGLRRIEFSQERSEDTP